MVRVLVVSIAFALFSCSGSAEDPSDSIVEDSLGGVQIDESRVSAVEYNDQLSLMQQDVVDMITVLFNSDTSEVDLNLENTLFEIDMNLTELDEMEFEGGEAFRDETRSFLLFYKEELNGGFQEIVPLLRRADLSQDEIDQLNAYDLEFAEKEKAAFEKVSLAQEEFASEHDIYLMER